jgi:hypothetical protein
MPDKKKAFNYLRLLFTAASGFILPMPLTSFFFVLLGGIVSLTPNGPVQPGVISSIIGLIILSGPAILSGFLPVILLWGRKGITALKGFVLGSIGPALFAALVSGIVIGHFGIDDVISQRISEGPQSLTPPPDVPGLIMLWVIISLTYGALGGIGGYAAVRIARTGKTKK